MSPPRIGHLPEGAAVAYVPRRIGYHAAHSGYDVLFASMGLPAAYSPSWASAGRRLPRALAWRLWALRPQGTNQDGLAAELGALPWVRKPQGLSHFIYGEDTYFYTPLWRHAGHRLLATYHFEPDRLVQRVSPTAVRSLDAVVVVGRNQVDYFRRFLPEDRIHYVPHHVDTDFFSPGTPPPREDVTRVVFAGRGNRDYDTLHRVIELAVSAEAGMRFDLLLPDPADHARFGGLADTHCHRGLSDDQLLALYRAAHVGLMPVHDCTANNSLLEMMACGLPVVGTAVGAMPDYAAPDGAVLTPVGDAEAMFQALQAVSADASLCQRMGTANRDRAEANFSMAISAGRMHGVYASLTAG
jgi:glycosyltransferase involved in cell wall biosynthesis